MSNYVPDRWSIIKCVHPDNDGPIYKVMGSWYGGYLNGDSWRINSGITKITETEDKFIFAGYSGSEYVCHKSTYGMHLTSHGVYESYKKKLEEAPGCEFKALSKEEAFTLKL